MRRENKVKKEVERLKVEGSKGRRVYESRRYECRAAYGIALRGYKEPLVLNLLNKEFRMMNREDEENESAYEPA